MARFVVLEPPAKESAASEARILRDGFSVMAFLFPPLFLLWHRLWLAGAACIAASLAAAALAETVGQPLAGTALSAVIGLYVGLEGGALRIAGLRRRGWQERAAIEADGLADAEIRYAEMALEEHAEGEWPWQAPPIQRLPPVRPGSVPALGMLAYPGRS